MAHKYELPHFEGNSRLTDEANQDCLKDFVRHLRIQVFYDPKDAADYAGLNRSTIIRYESGSIKKPPFGYLVALMEKLVEVGQFKEQELPEIRKDLLQELRNIVKFCPGYNREPLFYEWAELQIVAVAYLNASGARKIKWDAPGEEPEQLEQAVSFEDAPTIRPDISPVSAAEPLFRTEPRKNRRRGVAFGTIFVGLLFLSGLFLFVFKDSEARPDSVPGKGVIVVGEVILSTHSIPNNGTLVTATFRLRNTGAQYLYLKGLTAAVRGPDACALNWNATEADFPKISDIRLAPGEEYFYQQSRSFDLPGYYFVEPTMSSANDVWGGIWPWPRTGFTVSDARTGRITAADCLLGVTDIQLSTATLAVGQPLTASFGVKNIGGGTLSLKQLTGIVRGADDRNYGLPPAFFPSNLDLFLKPGEAFDFKQSRVFNRAGDYWLELDYQDSSGKWNSIWPYARAHFKVVEDE